VKIGIIFFLLLLSFIVKRELYLTLIVARNLRNSL
jgi:hypothetical protein